MIETIIKPVMDVVISVIQSILTFLSNISFVQTWLYEILLGISILIAVILKKFTKLFEIIDVQFYAFVSTLIFIILYLILNWRI